jgi:hypothetical protein
MASKQQQRALQVWSLLAFAAQNHKILSYAALGKLIGVPIHGLAPILDLIHKYCHRRRLPHLNYLVVSEVTGLPLFLPPVPAAVFTEQSRAFVFDWCGRSAPIATHFRHGRGVQ